MKLKNAISVRAFPAVVMTCLLLWSCGRHGHDNRLDEVAAIVSDEPEKALVMLEAISPDSLSEADGHYRDFLTIKARDKSYIEHTDDSLYRDVLDYYSKRRDKKLYPEVLYYGGRVYSDLGDYPTSLGYFQQALDALPEGSSINKLRANILSQTGWILTTMRMYSEAIPYMEESIRIDRVEKDTVNWIYDLYMFCSLHLNNQEHQLAKNDIDLALKLGSNLNDNFNTESKIYLAQIYNETGHPDSARTTLAEIINKNQNWDNFALSVIAETFLNSEVTDSAKLYANKLINSSSLNNKKLGYNILLSDKLKFTIPYDSLIHYVCDYHRVLERALNQNESRMVITQQAQYNYRLHDKERQKSEESVERLYQLLLLCLLALFVTICLLLYNRIRNKNRVIALQGAIHELRASMGDNNGLTSVNAISRSALLEDYRKELLEKARNQTKEISPEVSCLETECYRKLKGYIETGNPIVSNKELWKDLEATVDVVYPRFKTNLLLLTNGKLNDSDWKTAILIKLGVTPTQMSVLLSLSKGAIVSRRDAISRKLFGEKQSTRVTDRAIRLL